MVHLVGSYYADFSLTLALDGGGSSTTRHGRFTPGKDPLPIVQYVGCDTGPVWTDVENLAPHRNSIPGVSQYRLSYPGPH